MDMKPVLSLRANNYLDSPTHKVYNLCRKELNTTVIIDSFTMDFTRKRVISELNPLIRNLLNLKESKFMDYCDFLTKCNLEIPKHFHHFWQPKTDELYYFININEQIGCEYKVSPTHNSYNAFPTVELAERAIGVSKLSRLILLWQYTNNCSFEPDWHDHNRYLWYLEYIPAEKRLAVYFTDCTKIDTLFFEEEEHALAFIKVHEKEIKDLMEV